MSTNVLFIAYHAASYPIMESQVFAYIRNLSKLGANYSILTFETKSTIVESRLRISELGAAFKWRYLLYHRKPRFLVTMLDIFCGMFSAFFIIKREKINVIHARGLIPALIGFLPARLCGAKFFFDTRGLLADKYVGGGLLTQRSLTYKLMKRGEDYLLRKSDYFTVETYKHAEIIKSSMNCLARKMEIIPCCIDVNKFYCPPLADNFKADEEFSLIYLGKIGTWYLIEEMLDFFNVVSSNIWNPHFTFLTQDDPAPLYTLAINKGIDAEKIISRKVEIKEIPGFLRQAKAGIFFINPYKRYNSSPIKFGEYLACGVPVIINSGIGDCEEIVLGERVGVVINEFSFREYERAVKELNSLLFEGDILRKRCVQAAEKYLSLEMGVNRYWNIYQKLKGA